MVGPRPFHGPDYCHSGDKGITAQVMMTGDDDRLSLIHI